MESPDPSLTVSMDVCLLGLILVSFGAVPMVVNQSLQLQLGDDLKNLLSQQDTKDDSTTSVCKIKLSPTNLVSNINETVVSKINIMLI